ncbi:MAG TPA: 4Fe-4S dicluster domain-containing protein, partial [Tepidisphaeraceae bacterium]
PELADRLATAGIKANRWTGPDFIAQLREPARKPLKAVLCAALDLDPVLPLQQGLVSTRATEIAAGIMALATLTSAGRGLLALPEDSPAHVVAATRAAAAATGLRLYPLPDEYPLAHPSLLTHRILHRRLPHDRLPTDAGVIFIDAPIAVALGRYFLHGEPMLEVPVGVYDRGLAKAHLAWVPIGTRLRDLLVAINIAPTAVDLRVGHLLRDLHTSADAIIGAGELTVLAAEGHARLPAAACLRCGWCVEACPVQIHPAGLLEAAQQEDVLMADRFGLQSCIECGICSYVCPSRLPLLGAIRGMKAERP